MEGGSAYTSHVGSRIGSYTSHEHESRGGGGGGGGGGGEKGAGLPYIITNLSEQRHPIACIFHG